MLTNVNILFKTFTREGCFISWRTATANFFNILSSVLINRINFRTRRKIIILKFCYTFNYKTHVKRDHKQSINKKKLRFDDSHLKFIAFIN